MRFTETQPNENFPIMRMISETGRWEIGYWPVLYGVRVRLGLTGSPGCDVDYCCGASTKLRAEVLLVMLVILETVGEQAPQGEISDLFPMAWAKPIDRDSVWPLLVEFARECEGRVVNESINLQVSS